MTSGSFIFLNVTNNYKIQILLLWAIENASKKLMENEITPYSKRTKKNSQEKNCVQCFKCFDQTFS
jgi:hypothetical protein